jgi:PAS domain S-box-containing protein
MLNNQFTFVRKYAKVLKYSQTTINNYLIKQLPTAVVFLNFKLEVVHASDKWVIDFNFSDKDVIGKSFYELFDTVGKEWQEVLESCMLGKGEDKGIFRFIDDQGNECWYEQLYLPWYDEKENIIGIIIKTEEITEKMQREQEHEKLKLLLKEKSEMAKIGSWEYDAASDKLQWSDMTRRIHEVPEDFVPDIDESMHFYKEGYSRNTISMAVYKAMENKAPWCEKLEIITAGGNEKWVIATGKPLFKKGKYVGLIGTFQDITHIVLSEIKTRESEALLRTVIDNLPLNVYIKDLESRKILVNRAECEYLGVSDPEELLGKSDFDLYDPEIAQISRDEDLYVMNTKSPILSRETINVRPDGSATSFLTSKIPLKGEDGEPYGLIGISLDISHLKQQEAELRNLINVTSLQNKKLINFAHIVSHNLRSHSANFSMLLDFLVTEKNEEEQKNILQMLTKA